MDICNDYKFGSKQSLISKGFCESACMYGLVVFYCYISCFTGVCVCLFPVLSVLSEF